MRDVAINTTGLKTIPSSTVANLPGAAGLEGQTRYATDLNAAPATSIGLTAAGGGTYRGLVRSDGSAWKIAGNPLP
jgi:hypothetical protein